MFLVASSYHGWVSSLLVDLQQKLSTQVSAWFPKTMASDNATVDMNAGVV